MDELFKIKIGVLECRKKLKDLAAGMGVEYTKLIRILNRFEKTPIEFVNNANMIIDKWRYESEMRNGFNEHQ